LSGITIYGLLDYLHNLLLVFWLGTELGVLLAAFLGVTKPIFALAV